jgi:adenylate cyclase
VKTSAVKEGTANAVPVFLLALSEAPLMVNATNNYFGILAGLMSRVPGSPSGWTQKYISDVIARCDRRIDVLRDRIDGVTTGRVMPDLDQVTIGSGKHFRLAVLFLDICSFSSRPNWTESEQKVVLQMMNIFMAEMLNIVRDKGGVYEKNTGDGFMAYFGEDVPTDLETIKPAVEAATIMHYINDNLLSPWFIKQGIEAVRFRLGIDVGPVTIARVGLKGEENSRVAIGTIANVACKLMNLIPDGGICIGNNVYQSLPHNWETDCKRCQQETGFIYIATREPYPAWELNYRLTKPLP